MAGGPRGDSVLNVCILVEFQVRTAGCDVEESCTSRIADPSTGAGVSVERQTLVVSTYYLLNIMRVVSYILRVTFPLTNASASAHVPSL